MRTDKTASHICYELDHDVQDYAKRLLAKKNSARGTAGQYCFIA